MLALAAMQLALKLMWQTVHAFSCPFTTDSSPIQAVSAILIEATMASLRPYSQ